MSSFAGEPSKLLLMFCLLAGAEVGMMSGKSGTEVGMGFVTSCICSCINLFLS